MVHKQETARPLHSRVSSESPEATPAETSSPPPSFLTAAFLRPSTWSPPGVTTQYLEPGHFSPDQRGTRRTAWRAPSAARTLRGLRLVVGPRDGLLCAYMQPTPPPRPTCHLRHPCTEFAFQNILLGSTFHSRYNAWHCISSLVKEYCALNTVYVCNPVIQYLVDLD